MLVKSLNTAGAHSSSTMGNTSGVIGTSPDSTASTSSTTASVIPQQQEGDHRSIPPLQFCQFTHHVEHDSDHRRSWMRKIDFPVFDGFEVGVWLDKCTSYF
jgi:hypothetical protein